MKPRCNKADLFSEKFRGEEVISEPTHGIADFLTYWGLYLAVKDYICQRYSKSSQEGGGEGLGPFETFPKIHPLSHAKAILMSNLRGHKVTQIVSFLVEKGIVQTWLLLATLPIFLFIWVAEDDERVFWRCPEDEDEVRCLWRWVEVDVEE